MKKKKKNKQFFLVSRRVLSLKKSRKTKNWFNSPVCVFEIFDLLPPCILQGTHNNNSAGRYNFITFQIMSENWHFHKVVWLFQYGVFSLIFALAYGRSWLSHVDEQSMTPINLFNLFVYLIHFELILNPWSLILDPWSLILDSVILDPIFQGNPLQNDIQFHPVHFLLSYFNSTIPRLQTNYNYSANQVLTTKLLPTDLRKFHIARSRLFIARLA